MTSAMILAFIINYKWIFLWKGKGKKMDKLRVWWIPQAGATEDSFYVPVETVEEGKK